MTDTPENQRIAIVTGATRGLGWASAVALAEAGYHIVAMGRTIGALEELDDLILDKTGTRASLVPSDLTEYDTLDRMGAMLFERFGRVDALVLAAGVLGDLAPLAHYNAKAWDETINVNLTANYRLIRSMDPLLRLSDAGRIVAFSSGVARNPRANWGPYAASKAALDVMLRCYADEVADTTICANLLNPGPFRTGMRAQAMPGEDPTTLPHPREIGPLVVDMCSTSFTDNGELINFKDWAKTQTEPA